MDSHPQSLPSASSPAFRTEYRRPRGSDRRRCAIFDLQTRTNATTSRAGAPLAAPAAAAERPLQAMFLAKVRATLAVLRCWSTPSRLKGAPLLQPYRRQNPAVRREEMAQVQQMLASDVIRPSNSPSASPVVMVKKKDGILRFCVDFRQLNAATVKDAHPLPRIDDLLDALHRARWFSTLDLKSGYWQVPIMERDKEKTAFRTSSGQLYEFNQVPFGLCNAPATFSRLMDRVLSGLHWETCLFYLDDIIVFSSTWEEHLARLRQVFERLRHANLKLGPRNALSPLKRSVIWVTGSRRKASCQSRRSSRPSGRSRLPRPPPKSALSLVSQDTTGDM